MRKLIGLGALCLLVMTWVSVSFAQDDSGQDTTMILIPAGEFKMGTTPEQEQWLKDKGWWADWIGAGSGDRLALFLVPFAGARLDAVSS